MTDTAALFQILELILKQVHSSLVKKFNHGLSIHEINEMMATQQLTFPQEVYDLFTWKNGFKPSEAHPIIPLHLFPNGIPFTLDEALHCYDLLSITKQCFKPNYFPLFAGCSPASNDHILLIDLDQNSDSYRMISLYSPSMFGAADPMTIYDSLSSLLETTISSYDRRAFWIADEALVIDSRMFHTIMSDLNPNSEYWQHMQWALSQKMTMTSQINKCIPLKAYGCR
ncbi:hypothetical protein [Pedobacter panaciterrae]